MKHESPADPIERRLETHNPQMRALLASLPRLASTTASVLILGESGTGKELVARLLHTLGCRCAKRFVAINCAAIPEQLLESELFGHERGAFTGAQCTRKGLVLEADGGTLFLDEIGDMPLPLQGKLLRVLQEKCVTPVGGTTARTVDFRLISATHRDLKARCAQGLFRDDLLYRLNVIPLVVPPLRQRREDIPHLVRLFLGDAAQRNGIRLPSISNEAVSKLQSKRWSGNVRELENYVERLAVLFGQSGTILPEYVDDDEDDDDGSHSTERVWLDDDALPTVDELVDRYIIHVYERVDHHQGRASTILGLSRRTIYRKLKKFAADGSLLARSLKELPDIELN